MDGEVTVVDDGAHRDTRPAAVQQEPQEDRDPDGDRDQENDEHGND